MENPIQSRYPEEIESALPFAGPKISHNTLERTEKIVEWLSSMI
jgi:hypothetical protein